jgi:hypothetical protein
LAEQELICSSRSLLIMSLEGFNKAQQRLLDYVIFTGESISYLNNHFVTAGGKAPFTAAEIAKIHSSVKKNRERAIDSYRRGSDRSSFRPTLPVGYDPKDNDITPHPLRPTPRELKEFTLRHYYSQTRQTSTHRNTMTKKNSTPKKTSKKSTSKRKKVPRSSLSALPPDVTDKDQVSLLPADCTNVEINGLPYALYNVVFSENSNSWYSGSSYHLTATYNENDQEKKLGGQKQLVSSVLVSALFPSAKGFDSILLARPSVSPDDSKVLLMQLVTGSTKVIKQLDSIIRQLEHAENNDVAVKNLKILRHELKSNSVTHTNVALRFPDFELDPNIFSNEETIGTNEIPVNPTTGRNTVTSMLGEFVDSHYGFWSRVAVKDENKATDGREIDVEMSAIQRNMKMLEIGAAETESDSSVDSSGSFDGKSIPFYSFQ